jgi:hypothetical protein
MWVAGRPQIPSGQRCSWLVIFRTAAVRDVMKKQDAGADSLEQHAISMSNATWRQCSAAEL